MDYKISGGNADAKITLNETEQDGIVYAEVKADFGEAVIPGQFAVSFKFPAIDCYSVWSPSVGEARSLQPEWAARETNSSLASWMPVHQLVSAGGKNRLCIAVSDVMTPVSIKTGICEFDACISCEVAFFTRPTAKRSSYRALIRLDTNVVPYYDSIYGVTDWWENECGYTPANVPDMAKRPVNSLWYSMHHGLNPEKIVKQCRLSKPLGMDTLIIDDGWQMDIEEGNCFYARCGDWKASFQKMGDMRILCDRIHQIGMKVILWFSVPFIGTEAENYDRFHDMILDDSGENRTVFSLDPRYKEVRDFLMETYVNAVKSWDLDGLKLDFVDDFKIGEKGLKKDNRHDFVSLEEAIDALMSGITESLTAIKPDIMIEFRQSYVGPAMRKYGNILRVADCPDDPIRNRRGVVDLRYTSGKTAVHSDMLMWNYNESAESAAVQLAGILYSVPQISVLIDKLPAEHLEMLKFYLGFWTEHRDILLNGKLTAEHPECGYSAVRSSLGNDAVVTLYTDSYVACAKNKTAVVNATVSGDIIFSDCRNRNYTVKNCLGDTVAAGVFLNELNRLFVPAAGIVFVK